MASVPEEKKVRKKTIPKVVKDLSWNKWIGEDVAKHPCLCCRVNEIRMNNFHCGHVQAEANGGTTTVDNLRPICRACNLSMGTENMNEFKARCGFGVTPVVAPAKGPCNCNYADCAECTGRHTAKRVVTQQMPRVASDNGVFDLHAVIREARAKQRY